LSHDSQVLPEHHPMPEQKSNEILSAIGGLATLARLSQESGTDIDQSFFSVVFVVF